MYDKPSIYDIVPDLGWHSCARVLSQWICPPSKYNTVEQLHRTIIDGFETGDIPEWSIRRVYEDDKAALKQTADRINRDLQLEYAVLFAKNQELKAENQALKALLTLAGRPLSSAA